VEDVGNFTLYKIILVYFCPKGPPQEDIPWKLC